MTKTGVETWELMECMNSGRSSTELSRIMQIHCLTSQTWNHATCFLYALHVGFWRCKRLWPGLIQLPWAELYLLLKYIPVANVLRSLMPPLRRAAPAAQNNAPRILELQSITISESRLVASYAYLLRNPFLYATYLSPSSYSTIRFYNNRFQGLKRKPIY